MLLKELVICLSQHLPSIAVEQSPAQTNLLVEKTLVKLAQNTQNITRIGKAENLCFLTISVCCHLTLSSGWSKGCSLTLTVNEPMRSIRTGQQHKGQLQKTKWQNEWHHSSFQLPPPSWPRYYNWNSKWQLTSKNNQRAPSSLRKECQIPALKRF